MTNLKIKEEHSFIQGLINECMSKFGSGEWKDDNTLEFKKDKKVSGVLKLNDREINASGIEIIKVLKELLTKKEEAEKKKLTEEKVKKSIFNTDIITNSSVYYGLKDNPDMFWEIDKLLKKAGIEEVWIRKNLTRGNTVSDKMTLSFDCTCDDDCYDPAPSGFFTRLKNSLYEKFPNSLRNSDEIRTCGNGFIKPVQKEKFTEIKYKGTTIGRYYSERNFIQIYFNPFSMDKILPITQEMFPTIKAIIEVLTLLKLKKVKTRDFQKKIFIDAFLQQSERKLQDLKENIKSTERSISDYERNIQSYIRNINDYQEQISVIAKNLSTKGEGLYEEIEEAGKLPFIKDFKFGTDTVTFTFIPTTINIPNFGRTDRGKGFGKRTVYLGELKIEVGPSKFKIYNKEPVDYNGHPHPHASGEGGRPCFGDGDGRNKVYEMLAANRFVELAKLLWFWIKTYRNDGAYVKMWDVYDYKLSQGYPIWDEKGKRIGLNDAARIKSGEQIQLEKSSDYDKNIKAFEKMKVF